MDSTPFNNVTIHLLHHHPGLLLIERPNVNVPPNENDPSNVSTFSRPYVLLPANLLKEFLARSSFKNILFPLPSMIPVSLPHPPAPPLLPTLICYLLKSHSMMMILLAPVSPLPIYINSPCPSADIFLAAPSLLPFYPPSLQKSGGHLLLLPIQKSGGHFYLQTAP